MKRSPQKVKKYFTKKLFSFVAEPPPPPLGLQVMEITSQSVRVSWQIQDKHSGANVINIFKAILQLKEFNKSCSQFYYNRFGSKIFENWSIFDLLLVKF